MLLRRKNVSCPNNSDDDDGDLATAPRVPPPAVSCLTAAHGFNNWFNQKIMCKSCEMYVHRWCMQDLKKVKLVFAWELKTQLLLQYCLCLFKNEGIVSCDG